jgi:hypothetical protein
LDFDNQIFQQHYCDDDGDDVYRENHESRALLCCLLMEEAGSLATKRLEEGLGIDT